MSRHPITTVALALAGAGGLAACAAPDHVAPDAAAAASAAPAAARPEPGSYDISFWQRVSGVLVPVTSLQAESGALVLRAYVTDAEGAPVPQGRVMFQYCSYVGLPPNDIDRADEAPLSACLDGTANWANLGSAEVDASGFAEYFFGAVRVPRSIGFRCRYLGQGSGVESGYCDAEEFTWTP